MIVVILRRKMDLKSDRNFSSEQVCVKKHCGIIYPAKHIPYTKTETNS